MWSQPTDACVDLYALAPLFLLFVRLARTIAAHVAGGGKGEGSQALIAREPPLKIHVKEGVGGT